MRGMQTMSILEFWYEFASTYSYPAAMHVETLAEAAGLTVRWRPFLLGARSSGLLQGWTDSPFNIYPVKGRYMWRDLERICAKENLPLKLPPVRFPQNGLKAARLALVGEADGWTPAFTRAVYTANFGEQKDMRLDDATLEEILATAERRRRKRPRGIEHAREQGAIEGTNRRSASHAISSAHRPSR